MTFTPNLSLPYIQPSQAQKHVTHNEALRRLDAVVQISILSRDLAVPPATPSEGDRYIVAAAPSGVWAGQAGAIAAFQDGAWQFITPAQGWLAWLANEQSLAAFDGAAWVDAGGVNTLNPVDMIGINTTADANNRLAVSAPAVLLTHEGAGHQLKINKAAAADTASLVFQTGFSGRAEMGLAGDDDWRIKVSGDGATWKEALRLNRATGSVALPNGLVDPSTGLRPLMILPAPVRDIWRSDIDGPATPRLYTIASVAGTAVTLTTNEVEQFYNATMQNAAMVRIWNISKTPAQPAWVDWNLSANQFRVRDAASIAAWTSGEQLRIGDPNPTGTNALQMVAVDISNHLFNSFGSVFRQRGLKLSFGVQGVGGRVSADCSGTGAVGTALGVISGSDGGRQSAFVDVFTNELSPVSNSNLLFVRESLAGGTAMAATRLVRLVGIWV
ncbi:MAG: DUF2793 domain-containing protein [Phyllobacteriaceae bacterium]|nr:DUF2793 domain-containing protein [Phyllobacteriaceae bacterium]